MLSLLNLFLTVILRDRVFHLPFCTRGRCRCRRSDVMGLKCESRHRNLQKPPGLLKYEAKVSSPAPKPYCPASSHPMMEEGPSDAKSPFFSPQKRSWDFELQCGIFYISVASQNVKPRRDSREPHLRLIDTLQPVWSESSWGDQRCLFGSRLD